jgi:5'-phosphate synthase pdxT subunit
MRIAVLALQGDFAEHEAIFHRLNVPTCQLRQKSDLKLDFDALVLPGGESTVQGKLLRELDIFNDIHSMIQEGLPVMATCAGTILLAEKLLDDTVVHLGTMKISVRRNAYGRQLSSFYTVGDFAGIKDVPMSFIRAPQIESCRTGVEILAEHDGIITAARDGNQLAMTFHPELGTDCRVAEYFLAEMM